MSVSCRSFTSFEDDGGYREVMGGEEALHVTSRQISSRPLRVRRVMRIECADLLDPCVRPARSELRPSSIVQLDSHQISIRGFIRDPAFHAELGVGWTDAEGRAVRVGGERKLITRGRVDRSGPRRGGASG